MKNKTKLILLIIAVLLISSIGVTLAYFITSTDYVNEFNSKKYNVEMTEDFDEDWGKKIVNFTNKEDSTPVFLRIRITEEWYNSNGDNLPSVLNNNETVIKTWGDDYSSFVLLEDGYYYYKKVLNSNETVNFLKAINKNETVLDDRYGDGYNMSIYYEAIQATCDAAKELWRLDTCTLSGNNVVWK